MAEQTNNTFELTGFFLRKLLNVTNKGGAFRRANAIYKIKMQPFFGEWVINKSDTITIRRPIQYEAING